MKKILYSIALFLFSTIAFGQDSVIVKGTLTNLNNHDISIVYHENGKKKRVIASSNDNYFEVSFVIDAPTGIDIYPVKYFDNAVKIKGTENYLIAPPLFLFAAPGDQISITGDAMRMWEAQSTGGKFNKELQSFNQEFVPITGEIFEHSSRRRQFSNEDNQEAAQHLYAEIGKLAGHKREIINAYFHNNPTNLLSLYLFSKSLSKMEPVEITSLLNRYPPDLQNSESGQTIKDFLLKKEKVDIGKKMISFYGKTIEGKNFDSNELRGKYVLLDFWGSWCVPCRRSHPHLLALYNQYKNRGFEIVGIASERGSDPSSAWKKAVNEDHIHWVHLLNNALEDEQNIVEAYQVKAFPTKILIDPNGNIIWKATGDGGRELDNKLIEIFRE